MTNISKTLKKLENGASVSNEEMQQFYDNFDINKSSPMRANSLTVILYQLNSIDNKERNAIELNVIKLLNIRIKGIEDYRLLSRTWITMYCLTGNFECVKLLCEINADFDDDELLINRAIKNTIIGGMFLEIKEGIFDNHFEILKFFFKKYPKKVRMYLMEIRTPITNISEFINKLSE